MYLVLDIDGTLTNSDKEITDATAWALIQMQMRGHHIVLATGRPTFGVKWIIDTLKMRRYGGFVLSFNGGRITNTKTMSVVYQKEFPRELIRPVYSYARDKYIGLLTYQDDKIVLGTESDEFVRKERALNKMRLSKTADFLNYVNFPINKILLTAPPEDAEMLLPEIQELWRDKLSVYRSEPYFIEMMPLGVDKADSLAKLFQIEHVSLDDVVAVGDGFNDISMLKYVPNSVAMANAQPEVKAIASYTTTKSNDEDGIVEVIEKYFR